MDKVFWTEVGIAALIAFGATFAGVYLAFWKERRRAEVEENEQFGQILHGALVESAHNHAILTKIKNTARAGRTLVGEVRTEALQLALGSPLFYRKAPHSLVLAALLVRNQLGGMNNILSLYRQAAAGGREMTEGDAQGVQTHTEATAECIRVMQELLDARIAEFGAAVRADAQLQRTGERLAEILRRQDEQLEQLHLWGPRGT